MSSRSYNIGSNVGQITFTQSYTFKHQIQLLYLKKCIRDFKIGISIKNDEIRIK